MGKAEETNFRKCFYSYKSLYLLSIFYRPGTVLKLDSHKHYKETTMISISTRHREVRSLLQNHTAITGRAGLWPGSPEAGGLTTLPLSVRISLC